MWCNDSLVKFKHAWSIPHEDMKVVGAIVGIFESFISHFGFEADICVKQFLELEITKTWKKSNFIEFT